MKLTLYGVFRTLMFFRDFSLMSPLMTMDEKDKYDLALTGLKMCIKGEMHKLDKTKKTELTNRFLIKIM